MTLFKKLFTLLLLVLSFASSAMDDPWKILDNSAKASHKLNYEGIFHSQTSSESNSTHIIHANIDKKEYCLLKMLDGAPSEVFSDGEMVYVKSQNRLIIKKRKNQFLFPSILPSDIDNLKVNVAFWKFNIFHENQEVVKFKKRDLDKFLQWSEVVNTN